MQLMNGKHISVENIVISSSFLNREVVVDFFAPMQTIDPSSLNLLLINDGQNLAEMNLSSILEALYKGNEIEPLLCVGIHAGNDRKMEYGVAAQPDYLGRGNGAGLYTAFVLQELLPSIYKYYAIKSFKEKAIAGFSLGGLMALDIVWNNPREFVKAGVFSGSFWWRSHDQYSAIYDDDIHRIMPQEIRRRNHFEGLKFFFQCGQLDETMDRNNNGIIDSIDDTMAVIYELKQKGYTLEKDICYLEMPEGSHDIPTWEKAMPDFLKWGWALKCNI